MVLGMIGWIILASLSTTKEIFTGGLLASGLHFENYTKALFTNKAALNLLKHIKNVSIKDNTLKGVNGGKAIDLYLLDNCTISGNTIEGFERPIVANSCDEQFISDTDIVTE